MEMCQCVRNTTWKGVCELFPSASERLGFPEKENSGNDGYVCDTSASGDSFPSWCVIENRFSSRKSLVYAEQFTNSDSRNPRGNSTSTTTNSIPTERRPCSCLYTSSSTRGYRTISAFFRINLSSFFLLNKSIIIISLLLVSNVLVESAPFPSHKHRHHHDKPDDLPQCSEEAGQRYRRDVHSMTLKESQTTGLCPSWACLDIDERRRPVHITRVFCHHDVKNASCSALGGDFHCTQVYAQVEVWQEDVKPRDGVGLTELWTADNKTLAMTPTKISVQHGCMCASKKAKPIVNPLNLVS